MTGPFESNDVVKIVGIRPIYLNKFVERKLYGIEPSVRAGAGRGSRRWFNVDDVLGIALVWWLFEAGFRTEVIKRLLREIGKSKTADAKAVVAALIHSANFLLIIRNPRLSGDKKERTPQVAVANDDLLDRMKEIDKESFHVLPVGRLFSDLIMQFKKYL